MNQKAIDRISPLAADLRVQNPDRYLATLFAPPARREALFALYAFDSELARMQEIVKEPMAGLIRLQWWQDVIDGFGRGETVAHPVAKGLERAVTEDGLDPAYLRRAIDGRRKPFEDDLAPDPEAFERYLLDIGGSVSCAAASLLGADQQETLAAADRVGLVGAAWEKLRFLETQTPDRRAWLPLAWREGEDAGDWPTAAARAQFADWAFGELVEARRQKAAIPRSSLAAFFPGTLAGVRLGDPNGANLQPTLPSAVPRLIWCWLRGRF